MYHCRYHARALRDVVVVNVGLRWRERGGRCGGSKIGRRTVPGDVDWLVPDKGRTLKLVQHFSHSSALPCMQHVQQPPPHADMATKRSAPPVHPSRQDQVPGEPRRKRQKPNNAGPNSYKNAHPVNELKNQVRSLKRLLERNDGLPATVRVEKERALQTAQHELQEAEKAKKYSDMIGKYHKIRFFDRQKAAKRLKRAQKELKACESDAPERMRLEQVVKDREVDVNYAQYFPLDQPYVSLFPRKSGNEEGSEGNVESERKGDDVMWQKVKQCMVDGTLQALRDGRLRKERSDGGEEQPKSTVKRRDRGSHGEDSISKGKGGDSKDRTRKRHADDDADDDDSDGGFFE